MFTNLHIFYVKHFLDILDLVEGTRPLKKVAWLGVGTYHMDIATTLHPSKRWGDSVNECFFCFFFCLSLAEYDMFVEAPKDSPDMRLDHG